jgi:hypothetical protein
MLCYSDQIGEARTTAAQTPEVVYGPIQNMKVVMDGAEIQVD